MADVNDPIQNPMGALQSMALSRAQSGMGRMDQARGSYDTQMEELQQQVRQPLPEAAMWGALAKGAGAVAPVAGNFGAMLASMGSNYGQFQQQAQTRRDAAELQIAKLRESELRALESKDSTAAYLKALTPGGGKGGKPFEFRRNSDGTTTAFSNSTGLPVGTYGPQDIGKLSSMTEALAKAALEKGKYADLDEAMAWAQGQAISQIRGMNEEVGNRSAPLSPKTEGGLPTVASPSKPPESLLQGGEGNVQFDFDVTNLDEVDRSQLKGIIEAWKKNPTPQTQARIESVLSRMSDSGKLQLPPSSPPSTMPKKDVPKEEMEKATAGKTGEYLAKEQGDLNTAADAAAQLQGQLATLKQLYQTPNMPEGQLGEGIQAVRSGMKSLGIDVGPEVGAGDLAGAIAGKLALTTRTADGNNLMPGAMSNYEQQVLRSLVPGLQSTQEGRLALIDFMNEVMKTRMRFAQEANKMAEGNRGILPSEWNTRRARIMKEEMARLAVINKQIAQRFQNGN